MNEKEFKELFMDRPIFTAKQVGSLMGRGYARVYLKRLVERGSVFRLRKGYYTFHQDPMIYATHITYPSYISLNWGLQLHGLITQVPRIVEVISNRNATYPLVEMIRSKYVWGFVRRVYNDNEIFIGLKEKVVIDGIVHERIALDDILSSLGSCDPSLLEEMVLRLDRSDIKRVGYVCSLGGIELKDAKRSMRNDRNYVRSAYHQGKNEWRVIL